MPITRRGLLAAGTSLGGAALLGACTTKPGSAPTTTGNDVRLPSYLPYLGVTPDAPATGTGAAPYFRRFPADPPAFTTGKPMNGGRISLLTYLNTAPTPLAENRWWQAINTALGGEVAMAGAPVGDYAAKFQVTVASNDLPDLAVIQADNTPALAALLASKFQDLTPYLSGDAIKDYPGLANIPPVAWENCVYNGGIFLLPIQRFSLARSYLMRADLAARYGVNPQPGSGPELMAALKGLADPKNKRFATAHVFGLLDLVNEMHGTPNKWSVCEGRFTKDYEHEGFTEALAVVAQAWRDELIHPIAFDANFSLQTQGFYNTGVTPFFPGVASWAVNAIGPMKLNPEATSVALQVQKWDGSGPAGRWLGRGAPYVTAVRKASPDRIKEVLRVVDWLASPWGTRENLLLRYGVEGHDHTVGADGSLKHTKVGQAEYPGGLTYGGSAAMVHFDAAHPEVARAEYDSEVLAMQTAVPLPTIGLESPTDLSKGAGLTKQMKDLQADIIQGRQPVSAWTEGVRTWRSKGGDTIRAEYEAAMAARGH